MVPHSNLAVSHQQIELIAPHYSWDTENFGSSSSSSSPSSLSASIKWSHEGEEGETIIGLEGDEPQEERLAAYFIESLLARVRNVGYSIVAPDSVHKAVRELPKRKVLMPPETIIRKRGMGWNNRAENALLAGGPAPPTVDAATSMLESFHGVGPHAQVQAPGYINAAVSIGTAAAGGIKMRSEAPLQEPFSVFLPPPYRIIFLIALGLLCWSANLRALRRIGLDADGLMSAEAKVKVLPHHRSRGEQISSASTIPTVSSQGSIFSSSRTLVGSVDTELAVYFRHPGPQETAAFHLGLLCFIWATACWITYRLYAFHTIFYGGDQVGGFAHARGRHAQALQSIAVFGVFVVAVWPGDVAYRSMRRALGKQLALVCWPSLKQPIHFPQVLFADILTSFARVFGDLWLTMCFLWPKSDTPAWWNGKGSIAVPILVSLPYVIRFRQCLSEYNVSQPLPGTMDKPLKPLYNAAKYASAFPVIWLSVMQGDKNNPIQDDAANSSTSFYLWVMAVLLNSFFSFWWDVTHDWGLQMLKWETWTATSASMAQNFKSLHKRSFSSLPPIKQHSPPRNDSDRPKSPQLGATTNGNGGTHSRPHHMLGGNGNLGVPANASSSHLRNQSSFLRAPEHVMLFPPIVYQMAIICDLILRFAWSLKLSSHLHHIIELESTAFYLEAMEILRRWAWTFLRLEWEICKRKSWDAEGSMESLTLATLRSDNNQAAHHDVSTVQFVKQK